MNWFCNVLHTLQYFDANKTPCNLYTNVRLTVILLRYMIWFCTSQWQMVANVSRLDTFELCLECLVHWSAFPQGNTELANCNCNLVIMTLPQAPFRENLLNTRVN